MRLLAGIVALFLSTTASAHAATLSATSGNPALVSNFKVEFNDLNGNDILEYHEISGFSGITQFADGTLPSFLADLIGIPTILGFSLAGGNDTCGCTPNGWFFAASPSAMDLAAFDSGQFTYELEVSAVAPIPLPASALLLGAAVTGLLALRRVRSA